MLKGKEDPASPSHPPDRRDESVDSDQEGPSEQGAGTAVRVRSTDGADAGRDTPDGPTAIAPGRIYRASAMVDEDSPGRLEALSRGAPWIAFPVAAAFVSASYAWAASHTDGTFQFTLFWVGMLIAVVPSAFRLALRSPSRVERHCLVAAIALFFFLPKVLRHVGGPIYADEIAHWRQSSVAVSTGDLTPKNPFISVANSFPSLHAVTVALHSATGLTVYAAGVVLVSAFLVLNVVGVFTLAETLTHSARAASLAALVYSLNSSFMFFDTQYAYESMALPLFIWVVVAMARSQRSAARRRESLGWLGVALVTAAGLTVTHHLTSYVLALLLVLASVVSVLLRRAGRIGLLPARGLYLLTAAFLEMVAIWTFFFAQDVYGYLAPHLSGGVEQLSSLISHQGSGGRQLFQKSTSPRYEHVFAFVAPGVAAAVAVLGLPTLRRRVFRSALLLAVVLLGFLYFPSVPFILTPAGAEAARRSWAFAYVGLAIVIALSFEGLLRRARRRGEPAWSGAGAIAGVVFVLLLGNVAAGLSVEYRFPGPYVFGSDARSVGAEQLDATARFTAAHGQNIRIIANRSDGLAFGLLGFNEPERAYSGYPLWQFYFDPQRPDPSLFATLRYRDVQFLIVDKRTPLELPRTGVLMNRSEPLANRRTTPPPRAAIDKYDITPWTARVYESTNIEVNRFVYGGLGVCTDQAPEPGVSQAGCPK